MNCLSLEAEDNVANLLKYAANNDTDGLRKCIDRDPSSINKSGFWYGRQKGVNHMVLQQRTPLMVASTYGNIKVITLMLTLPEIAVNQCSPVDKCTALHCAAISGCPNALHVIKLLLVAGADPNMIDAYEHRPLDLLVVSPYLQDMRFYIEELLGSSKKVYPIDPSLPDINSSFFSTDEFRMYCFKIVPCSRRYSHDWTECPYAHPGENARRRDPRKINYSCIPCPEFKNGHCRKGDTCEYAHGPFESYLHPAQYKMRLCNDGMNCKRRVCFFAHSQEEIRSLYHSNGSFRSISSNLENIYHASPRYYDQALSSFYAFSPRMLQGNVFGQQFQSLGSSNPPGSLADTSSNCDSFTAYVDWSIDPDVLGRLKRAALERRSNRGRA